MLPGKLTMGDKYENEQGDIILHFKDHADGAAWHPQCGKIRRR